MSVIIHSVPDSNGAYKNQSWDDAYEVPAGFLKVPTGCLDLWSQYAPYVKVTIDEDTGLVVGIEDNPAARAANITEPTQIIPDPLTLRIQETEDLLFEIHYKQILLEMG